MKKNGFAILPMILLLSLLCQGCSNACRADFSIPKSSATIGTEANNPTNVIIRTNIYEITETNSRFNYSLFDNAGNVVKSESNLTTPPEIIHTENDVIRITMQAGTGTGTQWGFYYNQKNNTISGTFQCIFDEKNGIVVHATTDKIIIESIFKNGDIYYKEIDNFQKPFSKVAFPFVGAEFSENGHEISVSYYSGPDYEEATEIFTLEN